MRYFYLVIEGSGVVARITKSSRVVSSVRPPVASPRRQESRQPASGVSSPKRSLHGWLLCMHVTAVLAQGAGAIKYILPATDTSCVVTHRIMLAQLLFNDASLIHFLLAKVHVTNGSRALACWEKGIVWWSRLYAWIYIPGTFCFNGLSKEEVEDASASPNSASPTAAVNANSFAVNNSLLIVQFVLLLGLFVKPLLGRVQGTQSGGALYRKVVWRNVICTVGIVITYAITTIVVFLALVRESLLNNKSSQIRDAMLGVNSLGVLCLTEIALPLGFSSCLATCRNPAGEGYKTRNETIGGNTRTGASACTTTNNTKIVPVEALPHVAP